MRARPKIVELGQARRWLYCIWFPGTALLLFVLVAQTITRAYGDETSRLWSWALPNITPVLSLMLSVAGAEAMISRRNLAMRRIRRDFVVIVCGFSVVYIIFLLVPIIGQPIYFLVSDTVRLERARTELLDISSFWLAPLQGFVIGLICVLFTSYERQR